MQMKGLLTTGAAKSTSLNCFAIPVCQQFPPAFVTQVVLTGARAFIQQGILAGPKTGSKRDKEASTEFQLKRLSGSLYRTRSFRSCNNI